MAKKGRPPGRTVAINRKARRNYFIEETIEAGLVLTGTEVKSLRAGQGSIAEAYASEQDGELYLVNATIPEYKNANRFNHEPRRARKLLLHKRQLAKYLNEVRTGGMTIVPLSLYFSERGRAKVELALAKGKKFYDKRASEKARDWSRQKARLMREKG